MSDRRTPDLSTESGSNYRRSGSGRRAAPSGGGGGGGGGAGRQLGTNLLIAILIGGLVLAGWFIANQQQMLTAEQDKLAGRYPDRQEHQARYSRDHGSGCFGRRVL